MPVVAANVQVGIWLMTLDACCAPTKPVTAGARLGISSLYCTDGLGGVTVSLAGGR